MRIYIYTRAREGRQITLRNLSEAVLSKTTLFAHPSDGKHDLPSGFSDVVPYPAKFGYLGDVRQWVVDRHVKNFGVEENFVMLDDDFSFLVRKPEEPTHFRAAVPKDTTAIFTRIERLLRRGYGEVGLVARQAQHLNPDKLIVENTRIAGVLGFNTSALRQAKVRFNRLPTMTDFDACLQLLRAGFDNAMICEYAYGQPGSNTDGGCKVYRTLELQAQGAIGLAKLHPGFVKVVQRETKGSWKDDKDTPGYVERTDVTVYWRKAAASAERRKLTR